MIGAGVQFAKAHTNLISPEASKKHGAKLRGQAVSYCRRHQDEFVGFFCDDDDSEDADLRAQASFLEWLEAMNQPRTWVDGLCLKALSAQTGTILIIWKWTKDHWVRTTLAPSFNNGWARAAKGTKPICLLLRNQHYTWLKQPIDGNIPDGWLKESVFPNFKELEGSGKRTSPAGVPALSDQRSQGTRKTTKVSVSGTPSAHTVAVAKQEQCREVSGDSVFNSNCATPTVHTVLAAGRSPTKAQHDSPSKQKWMTRSPLQKLKQFNKSRSKDRQLGEGTSSGSKDAPLLREVQHGSGTQHMWDEVKTCQDWNQAQAWLQAISQGIPDQHLHKNSMGTLQACLLACSATMRLIHAAMDKVSDPEISLGRAEPVRDTELTEKIKEPERKALTKKRIKKVPQTEEEKKAISESFSWVCNLCNYSFSASCYGTWVSKKSRHIDRCHKDEKHLIADRRSLYPLVEVSNIKWAARHWTCSQCGLGLPWLPTSQLDRSRDAHMQKCAPDLTPEENRRILRTGQSKTDINYRLHARRKTGWHSIEWRKERISKAKEQGHELSSFVPAEGLLKTHFLRYTCKYCKRVQGETDCFTRDTCVPRKYPKGHVWRTLRMNYDKFMGDLVKLWGWGQQDVKEMDERINQTAANPRKKTNKPLPKIPSPGNKTWYRALPVVGDQKCKPRPQEAEWEKDLCQEGIEPNPGPGSKRIQKLRSGQDRCRDFPENLSKDHGPEPQHKTWIKDLCAEGVEPHPGPRVRRKRSSALDIAQININGRSNLWNLSQHFHTFGVDAICVQETHMDPQEQAQFAQSVWKKGWVTFGITTTSKRGVLTLVRKHWKSKILYQLDQPGGQCLAVQVGHLCLVNLYAAHDHDRETCTAQVFEFLQSLNPSPWVLTGDFNDEPHESPLALGLQGCDFFFCLPPPGVSSRWEGKRVIDYGISNCPFKHEHLDMMPEKWSDHRLCRMSIISPGMNDVNEQFEVVPTNRYQPQCSETFGDWTEQLLRGWAETKEKWETLCLQCEQQVNQLCADHSQVSKQDAANEIWNQVNLFS